GRGGGRVGDEPQEVGEADVDLPALEQPLPVGGDEDAVGVVGGVLHSGDGVHDAVAVLLVGAGGLAFVGQGQATGADAGAVTGGHREVRDLVAALVDLGGGEDGVVLGRGDLAGGVGGDGVGGEFGEPLGVARVDGAVGRGQQEHQVAGVRVAVGGDGEGVAGRVGGAHHGVRLDRGDGLLLVAAVPVA